MIKQQYITSIENHKFCEVDAYISLNKDQGFRVFLGIMLNIFILPKFYIY